MTGNITAALVHRSGGRTYSVSVDSVLWEAYKCDPAEGLPTPWEVLTEMVPDLIADVLVTNVPELFYDARTLAESWERVYGVADEMAAEWCRRFGRCN